MKREHWALIASLCAGLALAGFFAAPRLLAGPPRDPETLCLRTGPVGQTLILVDKSDPWSPVQAQRLKALVKQIGLNLPAERLLSVYVFNDTFEPNFPALLALCNPGRTASEWIGNPRRDYLKWAETFGRPLDASLALLALPAKGNQSPVAEALGDVMARRENRVASGDRVLILVSDMLQNSSQFSFFGQGSGAREPERLRRLVSRTWRDADGAGWHLQVHQIQGAYDGQRLEHAAHLWQQALRDAGIRFVWERL